MIVAFQKARFFQPGDATEITGTVPGRSSFSYHIEVRTLNARRMFREKLDKSVQDLFNLPRAEFSSILPVELLRMVKSGLDFSNFPFCLF